MLLDAFSKVPVGGRGGPGYWDQVTWIPFNTMEQRRGLARDTVREWFACYKQLLTPVSLLTRDKVKGCLELSTGAAKRKWLGVRVRGNELSLVQGPESLKGSEGLGSCVSIWRGNHCTSHCSHCVRWTVHTIHPCAPCSRSCQLARSGGLPHMLGDRKQHVQLYLPLYSQAPFAQFPGSGCGICFQI